MPFGLPRSHGVFEILFTRRIHPIMFFYLPSFMACVRNSAVLSVVSLSVFLFRVCVPLVYTSLGFSLSYPTAEQVDYSSSMVSGRPSLKKEHYSTIYL